jgi:hypothetical protein
VYLDINNEQFQEIFKNLFDSVEGALFSAELSENIRALGNFSNLIGEKSSK